MMDDKLKKMASTNAPPEEVENARRGFLDQIEKIARDAEAEVDRIREG